MGHIIRISGREQYIAALRVFDKIPGTWHSRGPRETPILLVEDLHYKALVQAGVVAPNGKSGTTREKKITAQKAPA